MPNEKESNKQIIYEGVYRKKVESMLRSMASDKATVTPRSFYDFDEEDINPPVRGDKHENKP